MEGQRLGSGYAVERGVPGGVPGRGDMSNLDRWFSSIHEAVSNLSVVLEGLEDRIAPVLRPAVPQPCCPDKQLAEAPGCELQLRCVSVDSRIRALVEQVGELTDRVYL